MLNRIIGRLRRSLTPVPEKLFPLRPVLPLPAGVTEEELFDFVTSVRVADAPEQEMRAYGTHDFRRFVYTLGLTQGLEGKCLELGANPYFTTMLLGTYAKFDVSFANYFGHIPNGTHYQDVAFKDPASGNRQTKRLSYEHFNVENDLFPYPDQTFDVVIFAEIIEHLLNDPCKVLREIKRVLKPGGTMILTTPNVARLENVAKLIAGENIYDPYSGYGPYGRHNREYNRHELVALCQFEGYAVEQHFTADVHANSAGNYVDLSVLKKLLTYRQGDLGQYLFIRAKKEFESPQKVPSWLYRSLPPDQLA